MSLKKVQYNNKFIVHLLKKKQNRRSCVFVKNGGSLNIFKIPHYRSIIIQKIHAYNDIRYSLYNHIGFTSNSVPIMTEVYIIKITKPHTRFLKL